MGMRFTWRQLEVLVAVADAGSTVAASDALALSQSATSAALLELERALGAPLFDRVGKSLQLNPEGRALLPQVRQLLRAGERLAQGLQGAEAVALQLVASTTIGNCVLPRLLGDCAHGLSAPAQAALAASQVRVANTAEVVHAIAAGEADIGFIEGPCHAPQLHAEPWLPDELLLVAAPGHPLAAQGQRLAGAPVAAPEGSADALPAGIAVTAAALRGERWLLREPGSGTREVVEQALAPHLPHFSAGIGFGSSEAIARAVMAGLGVAYLSQWVVREPLVRGALVQLVPPWPPLVRGFALVTAGAPTSPAVQRFLAYARDWAARWQAG